MACVRFRRGSWGVDWRDELGRRHWKTARSENEAGKLLARLAAEWTPFRSGSSGLTVGDYMTIWLEEVAARSKPKTVARYRSAWRSRLAPELAARPLEDVTRFELKRVLVKLHQGGVRLAMPVKVVSMVFSSAYEDGLIAQHPARRLKRLFRLEDNPRGAARRKGFTEEELARFLDASTREPVYDGLFRAMAFSGLRGGEARALQVRDVELEALSLHVERTFSDDALSSSPKSGHDRDVEIPASLAAELEELVRARAPESWVFHRNGQRLAAKAVQRAFKRACRRAELPARLTPHALRHTYASLLLARGARAEYVQRQLGHRSIRLTVDLYGRGAVLSDRPALDGFMAGVTSEAVTREMPRLHQFPKVVPFSCSKRVVASHGRRTSSSQSEVDHNEKEPK